MNNNFNKLDDLGDGPDRFEALVLVLKLLWFSIRPMDRLARKNAITDSIANTMKEIGIALKDYHDFKHGMQSIIMNGSQYVSIPQYKDTSPDGRGAVLSSIGDALMGKLSEQEMLLRVKSEECNNAYTERARLVAHLSKCYPSYKVVKNDVPYQGYNTIVYVESDNGQMSWHIADDDVHLFEHLEDVDIEEVYDGHTTEEKYERLAQCTEDLLDPYFGTVGDVLDCRVSIKGDDAAVTDIIKTSAMSAYKEGESPKELFLKHDKHGSVVVLRYELTQEIHEGDETYTEDIFGDLDSQTDKPFKKKRTKLKIVKND